jgi:hypothetical protein
MPVSEQAKRIAYGALGPLRAKWEREYGQRKPEPEVKPTTAQALYPNHPSVERSAKDRRDD